MTDAVKVANKIILKGQEGPQTEFLASDADITIYGGSAGGGKSYGLLLAPLRHIDVPGFNCVIFRRTSPQIRNAGALWDTSSKIYHKVNGKPLESRLTWKWLQGKLHNKAELESAAIRFSHIEYDSDTHNFDGSQICWLAFDELQQFTEHMFFYMLSRNRSTCGVKPKILATCNPDSQSWLRGFVDWWIGEDGYCIADRSGVKRYFTRVDGIIQWGKSKAELLKNDEKFIYEYNEITRKYNKKKALINSRNKTKLKEIKDRAYGRLRELKKEAEISIKSVTFILSSVYDNKILLDTNETYLSNLKALPLVERERLLNGNWNIQAESGKFFNKDWLNVIDSNEIPEKGVECRFWDFAATAPSRKNKDPDYTVGVKIRKIDHEYFIIDVVRIRENPAEVQRIFKETAITDKALAEDLGLQYKIRWEEEGGSSGKHETYRLQSLLAGFDSRGVRSTGSKEIRAKPLAVQCEIGNVKLKKADWNEAYLNELHMFTDSTAKHDDMVDGSSGAFTALCSNQLHPTIAEEENNKENKEELENKRIKAYEELEDDFLNGIDIDFQ